MKRRKRNFRADHRGFSLVELIIVVTIISVLTGVIVPMYLQYIEDANIAKDRDTLSKIQKSLEMEYALRGNTPEQLMVNSFGGTNDTNNMIDMNTKGVFILQVNKDGTAQRVWGRQSYFVPGDFQYDALTAAGVDTAALMSGRKIQLFHSRALKNAVATDGNGYKFLAMAVGEGSSIRVWIGSRSENNGKHTHNSLPDERFSIGKMEYQ